MSLVHDYYYVYQSLLDIEVVLGVGINSTLATIEIARL